MTYRENQLVTLTATVRKNERHAVENHHIPSRNGAPVVIWQNCISLQDDNGQWWVIFTRGEFRKAVDVGQRVTIQAKFKREQRYGDGHQYVIKNPRLVA